MALDYSTAEIFGADGLISSGFKDYESRPQQIEMYEAIRNAIKLEKHLIIEAGTGVGKTFAYLIPAIQYSITTGKPVVISTNTINLQEQIMYKDIPFLRTVLGVHFSAALCKGRSNYLCKRRLNKALLNQSRIFEGMDEVEELGRIKKWNIEATPESDGSVSALSWVPADGVWSKVCAEHDNCAGKKCYHHHECYYQRARARLTASNLIIVNHPVLVIDAGLKQDDANFLPKYEVVIVDEAHRLESVAQDHLGMEISNDQLTYLFNTLYRPDKNRGFLTFLPAKNAKAKECKELVLDARDAAALFFENLLEWIKTKLPENGRIKNVAALAGMANTLTPALGRLYLCLKDLSQQMKVKGKSKKGRDREFSYDYDETELEAFVRRTMGFAGAMESFWKQDQKDNVYWIELRDRRRAMPRIVLKGAPLKVNRIIKDIVFDKVKTAILTSATLACYAPVNHTASPAVQNKPADKPNGTKDSNGPTSVAVIDPLKYIKENLGMENALGTVLGSPFDYQKQVKLYLTKDTPDPRTKEFEFAISHQILDYLGLTNGRAFVLFTSYDLMNRVHDRINNRLAQKGMPVYIQGKSMPRHQMLEKFKKNVGSVIFGADSFWQGVDVPGEALENIIITKLPFMVPSTPLIEARIEEMEKAGVDSFMNYFLPEAILKLRQGFGRLIRTKTDKGIVVILDSRMMTKNYGKFFLESLPKCQVIVKG
ncbi:MAG: ATP-dependent DNA helicase [Planctomycetota bacterium]